MKKRGEKGVTLIALAITISVLSILAFSITANIGGFNDLQNKTKFEEDIHKLSEQVEQYYARYKTIPVLNQYTNISMLEDIKNVNDTSTYWVLDVSRLGVDSLNYGVDYAPIKQMEDTSADVSQYTKVYIINRGSHTIYYPAGVEYDGKVHYTLENEYSNVNVTTTASIDFSGATTQTSTPTLQAEVKHISYTDIDLEECGWVLNTQSEEIGTDKQNYTNGFSVEEQNITLTMQNAGNYYLHVLTVDEDDNRKETVSSLVSVVANYHAHTGSATSGGGCYTTPVYHAHTGSASGGGGCYTTPVYHAHTGSTSGGGCYTVPVYHTHTGSASSGGGCYGQPVYHSHTTSCYATCTITTSGCWGQGNYNENGMMHCPCYITHSSCGQPQRQGWHVHPDDGNSHVNGDQRSTHQYLVCGRSTSTIEQYTINCGKSTSTIDSYNLGCGKTTSTIDSYNLGCGKTTSTIDSYNLGCGRTESTIDNYTITY